MIQHKPKVISIGKQESFGISSQGQFKCRFIYCLISVSARSRVNEKPTISFFVVFFCQKRNSCHVFSFIRELRGTVTLVASIVLLIAHISADILRAALFLAHFRQPKRRAYINVGERTFSCVFTYVVAVEEDSLLVQKMYRKLLLKEQKSKGKLKNQLVFKENALKAVAFFNILQFNVLQYKELSNFAGINPKNSW